MPLSDWQHTLNGLTMGPGTKYLYKVTGLYDFSAVPNDVDLLGNGTFAGRDRQPGRQIIFTYQIVDTPGSTFATTFGNFLTAWAVPASADVTLQWKVPGITHERKVSGRPRRRAFPLDPDFEAGVANVVCEFFATDPVVYDATTSTAVQY